MSSPIDLATEDPVVHNDNTPHPAPPPQPPPRRFPPPCWTQEETLALIEAYRERWYALRRGYLRTADWDAVAAAVRTTCPDASPPKTSAQCRHKMEKLRQRYRAEKQRSLSSPSGRFFSSWFFFDNMDAMENGTTVAAIRSNINPSDGAYALKTIIDQNLLKLKINSKNGLNDHPQNPSFMFNHAKPTEKSNNISNFGSRVPTGYRNYFEIGSNTEEDGFHVRNGVPMKAKRTGRIMGGDVNVFDQVGNYGVNPGLDYDEGSEYNDGLHVRGMGSRRGGYGANVEANRFSPGVSKPQGKKGSVGGAKRGRDPVEEMVFSIKLLGEGFLKMEKMKMEMAKEVEQMRMEMEMRRNEMILQSQKQIVDAFVKVLGEVHRNKNLKSES